MFTKEEVDTFRDKYKSSMPLLEKEIRMDLADGKCYGLPIALIVLEVVTYYSEIDGVSFDESFDELKEADGDYFIEQLENNMSFEECKNHFIDRGLATPIKINMEDSFINSEKEIF